MAYFYTSNYPEVLDNYQYYQHHHYNNYYDSRYVQYYDTELFSGNPYQHAPNPSLVGYYSSSYYQPEALNTSKNAYFHENGDEFYCYNEPVSTQYIISYNVNNGSEAEANTDIDFEEYNPEPFHGGYDIHATYGKPLPPSEKTCYPISKNDVPSNNDGSAPPQAIINGGKKVENGDEPKQSNGVISSKVIQDEEVEDDDDDDDDEYDDDEEEEEEEGGKQDDLGKEAVMAAPIASLGDASHAINGKQDQNLGEKDDDFVKKSSNGTKKVRFADDPIHGKDHNQNLGEVIQGEHPTKLQNKEEEEEELKEEDKKKEDENESHIMKRQIPPGYGMETLDLCEGIFGGYFPCFWKKYQRDNNQESGKINNEKMSDYEYCCKDTVDYLFGNPNPYGGMMQEKGSYGDPVYSYQRYYPHQTLAQHVDYYGGHSSGFQTSNYNYYQ